VKRILDGISESAKSDDRFLTLLAQAREYAGIYLMAKGRRKGCDGMGELATVREEYQAAMQELTDYCKGRGYSSAAAWDIDEAAEELADNFTG
jgi:hypothetical protein